MLLSNEVLTMLELLSQADNYGMFSCYSVAGMCQKILNAYEDAKVPQKQTKRYAGERFDVV